MSVEPGWSLAVALVLLLSLGTGALLLGRVKVAWQVPWAGVRAAVRLLLISYVVGWAVSSPGWGFVRRVAVREVVHDTVAEALIPALDQTRTAGLVSLSGAYIGVLLGGGTPLEAGAAQVLVLVGVVAGQPLTALVARELMSIGWLLPRSLEQQLHS